MFREFKEYQDIANLYQNKIYQTDEQIITESFESEKFTEEEAAFIEENFDALLEFVIEEETLSEQSMSDRMGKGYDKGVKSGKIPPKARVRSFSFNKGGQAVDKFKSALGKVGSKIGQFGKNVAKTASMQGSGAAKGAKLLSKLGPAGKAAAVATVAGGAIAAGLANRAKKNKAAKDAAIDKQVDDYVAKRKKPVVPGTRVNEIGAEGGGKPSEGNFKKDFPDKKPEDKKPEVSKLTKQGKPRTKAQMMAAKRIASGKTIQQVKDENKASMKAKAAERFKAFKEKRAEKKSAMEEYTPYDIVLEYLLSSEQVATIEEANYVMTEMDAETIQGIVEMQGQINRADIIGGTKAAKNAAKGIGKYTPGKGVTKDFKLDPNFKLPGV